MICYFVSFISYHVVPSRWHASVSRYSCPRPVSFASFVLSFALPSLPFLHPSRRAQHTACVLSCCACRLWSSSNSSAAAFLTTGLMIVERRRSAKACLWIWLVGQSVKLPAVCTQIEKETSSQGDSKMECDGKRKKIRTPFAP